MNIRGKKFGRLTALTKVAHPTIANAWAFLCDCGESKTINSDNVKRGLTMSCGCLHRERTGDAKRTHGQSRVRLHRIWMNMRDRCRREKSPSYANYGGRGIRICEEWDVFEAFRDWAVSNGYHDSLSLDRENNDLGYSPENCRWADRKTQARNTRRTLYVDFRGEKLPLAQVAENENIPYETARRWRREGKFG